ncbi:MULTISPECIES: hypothetical protein [unclassified Mesorhizobium]|uniref:hypothetical protein n=1 Tax=unclassified Mesorhizobium TaxID=325217 RepID=UPI0033384EF3
MPFAIQYKDEIVTELEEGEEWLVVGAMIMVAKPKDRAHSRKKGMGKTQTANRISQVCTQAGDAQDGLHGRSSVLKSLI